MILIKIRLHAKDLNEPKYEFWMKKREDVGIKYCTYPNSFIECSDTMHDVYDNIDEYNPSIKIFHLCLSLSRIFLFQKMSD